jgi:hypothetical protein
VLQEVLAEGLALQVLHDDVDGAVRELAVFVDVDDAGVADDVDGARLVAEAGGHLGSAGDVRVLDLDRGAAVQLLVYGLEHLAHAAVPELAHDLIATDYLTNHRRHGHAPPPRRALRLRRQPLGDRRCKSLASETILSHLVRCLDCVERAACQGASICFVCSCASAVSRTVES